MRDQLASNFGIISNPFWEGHDKKPNETTKKLMKQGGQARLIQEM